MAPFSHGMKGQPETVPSLALVGKDNRLATLAMMEAITPPVLGTYGISKVLLLIPTDENGLPCPAVEGGTAVSDANKR